jgi:hypothetical protein
LCRYFACVAHFNDGAGYVVECKDGFLSKSGGTAGSCAEYRGEKRPLFAP